VMSDDDKTPAREVIADYAQANFRYHHQRL
jgi:hypothetical protein